jgi:hypothetical protein
MSRHTIRLFALLSVVTLGASQAGAAAPKKPAKAAAPRKAAVPREAAPGAGGLLAKAEAFIKTHKLPSKLVKAGPADRKVPRLFFPVLPNQFDKFVTAFGEKGGGVIIRNTESNEHLAIALKAGDAYLWARNQNGKRDNNGYHGDLRQQYMDHSGGGHIMAVDLKPAELKHLKGWLAARERANDQLFCNGNCMEWLPNAEVGRGTPLFHALGITRSRDGRNMKAKLLHGANDKLRVVGVPVDSIEEFKQMSAADLLGNPPAGGIDDTVR